MHIATATAPGSMHTMPGQPGKTNNQDAVVSLKHGKGHIVVICDGCGTQPLSGTGADIGANLIAKALARQLSTTADVTMIEWEKVTEESILGVSEIVKLMAVGDSAAARERVVLERFLFTAIVMVVSNDQAVVASFGDGVLICDEDVTIIESPILNTPSYMGYLLIGKNVYQTPELRHHLQFKLVKSVRVSELSRGIIIGSDGLKDLINEDLQHPTLVQPKNLQRWINALTTDRFSGGEFIAGKCKDDVTLAILRSDEAQKRLIEEYRDIAELKQSIADLTSRVQKLSIELDRETQTREGAEARIRSLEADLALTEKMASKAELFEGEVDKLKGRLASMRGNVHAKPILGLVDAFIRLVKPPPPRIKVITARSQNVVYDPPGKGLPGHWMNGGELP